MCVFCLLRSINAACASRNGHAVDVQAECMRARRVREIKARALWDALWERDQVLNKFCARRPKH